VIWIAGNKVKEKVLLVLALILRGSRSCFRLLNSKLSENNLLLFFLHLLLLFLCLSSSPFSSERGQIG
jgi:hypothetical protein